MPTVSPPENWLRSPFLHWATASDWRSRAVVNAIIWSLVAVFVLYAHSWSITDLEARFLLTLINLTTIVISYHFLVNVGLPCLYQGKWLQLFLSVLATYIFNTLANYYAFNLLVNHYHTLTKIADQFGQGGSVLSALTGRMTFLINWSFTLSTLMVPLTLRVIRDLVMVRTKSAELERDNLKLELKFLQSQIQPHFVLNSINSVYAMVAGTDEDAGTLLLRLSDLLRYALHHSSSPIVSLAQEVEFLQGYISVEAARQHERTTLSFQYDGPFDRFQIPPLLLITFVENAFKHGINATYRQAWADIRLHVQENGTLSFRVENSKPPIEVQRKQKSKPSGLGLENTQRRLKLLFPDQHQLIIREDSDIFTVELTLQLEPVATIHPHNLIQSNSTLPMNGTTQLHLSDR